MTLQFMVGGQLLDADAIKKAAPKAKAKPKVEAEQQWHKGWRVMGHPPGAMEAARESRERELARWAGMSEERRKDARASGEREPKPWDEAEWRCVTHMKAVRSRPYGVPEAADLCADLARKQGWLDVAVVEQKKGEAAA